MILTMTANWPYGTELAEELLGAIDMIAKSQRGSGSMKRIDSDDFKAYVAGTVLRVDIPLENLR